MIVKYKLGRCVEVVVAYFQCHNNNMLFSESWKVNNSPVKIAFVSTVNAIYNLISLKEPLFIYNEII
jgi:hypothetical protein